MTGKNIFFTQAPLVILSRANLCCSIQFSKHQYHSEGVKEQSHQNLQYFQELNRLCSEGKWDQLNNRPKFWINRKDYKIGREHYDIQFPDQEKSWYRKHPYYMEFDSFLSIILLSSFLVLVGILYGMIPEEKRMKYKYSHLYETHTEEHNSRSVH